MRSTLGAIVLVVGVAALAIWGAEVHAKRMEDEIRIAADAIADGSLHPMDVSVSGRDITLTGLADSQGELERIVAQLTDIEGRRVVRSETVEILPLASPYDTALAKSADGSFGMSGTAPNDALADLLLDAGLSGAGDLPLASGAPDGWADAMLAGKAALDTLHDGSFALTDTRAILSGKAANPARAEAASEALSDLPEGFDPVIAIDLLDPGTVAFELRFDATEGLFGSGFVPDTLGPDGVAEALGFDAIAGDLATTNGRYEGLADRLSELAPYLSMLDALTIRVANGEMMVDARALPGLSTGLVASAIGRAVGAQAQVTVAPGIAPEDGATRVNTATGATELANAGYWLATPDFEISKANCNAAATDILAGRQIQYVSGSAELDGVSMGIINDLAGLVLYCTKPLGMRVFIGGHTDSDGDDDANYILSVARATAVRDALVERGVPVGRMQAIGYGETEPIADNDTEEGRAQNRRTSFIWPE